MKFKTLQQRFKFFNKTLEYKMGSDGKGYYIDNEFKTSSRDTIEEFLLFLEEHFKERLRIAYNENITNNGKNSKED